MFKLIYTLHKIGLLSPKGLFILVFNILKYGINLMTLLSVAEKLHSEKTALIDDNETLSYRKLLTQSEQLSIFLYEKLNLKSGQKVGFLCRNHASLVKSIFAVSQTGADIYLLNVEMSKKQFNDLLEQNDFSLLILDSELNTLIEQSNYSKGTLLSYHDKQLAVNNITKLQPIRKQRLKRASSGKLVILTGGTTGKFKAAAHKASVFNFLSPFLTMITRLNLLNYKTIYIATPIYHGYGVAILFLFTALGKKIIISRRFDAAKACFLVRSHNVEVITVVPLMIHKMIKCSIEDLMSLSCVVSGGAELNPNLSLEVMNKLGDVLYNLYGTSEAGLNIIATPDDLKYSINTIGRKINGVYLKVLDENRNEVKAGTTGQFCIRNKWSMKNNKNAWIETGDMGYYDRNGYWFLCGRVDDMVVSAGENVYPFDLEKVLLKHSGIEDAAVIGVSDEVFGQRLKAFVLLTEDAVLNEEELLDWLSTKVARYQMPRDIVFVESMPYTPLGKLDKKQLRDE